MSLIPVTFTASEYRDSMLPIAEFIEARLLPDMPVPTVDRRDLPIPDEIALLVTRNMLGTAKLLKEMSQPAARHSPIDLKVMEFASCMIRTSIKLFIKQSAFEPDKLFKQHTSNHLADASLKRKLCWFHAELLERQAQAITRHPPTDTTKVSALTPFSEVCFDHYFGICDNIPKPH